MRLKADEIRFVLDKNMLCIEMNGQPREDCDEEENESALAERCVKR